MPDNITHRKTIDTRTIPNRMTNPWQMVNFDRLMLLADLNGSKGGGQWRCASTALINR
jgi:hypothetical protein